ncbi:MAG TPA: hypothetical protein VMY59_00930 [Candidatus Thermoplasmatota archaeon]|nr:hypothetical protein [Candidatus Thermoplasmatota archaeon]
MKTKCLAVGIILLFVGIAVNPITGISNNRDDTTPPVTTISLNPPEPDGENGWYVSNVTVILNATDDISGVNITQYRIDCGSWQIYTEPFILVDDGNDICIEFYSIDNTGNQEEVESAVIDIDKTKPIIFLYYELIGGNSEDGWDVLFTATASDNVSGMNRVEFYLNDMLQETVTGSGPDYHWIYHYPSVFEFRVLGLITKLEITQDYVKFFALIVRISGPLYHPPYFAAYGYDNAGNWDWMDIMQPSFSVNITGGIYLFQNVTLPNNYTGHIGRFFIKATFYDSIEE